MRCSQTLETRFGIMPILAGLSRLCEQDDQQVFHSQPGELYPVKFFGTIALF